MTRLLNITLLMFFISTLFSNCRTQLEQNSYPKYDLSYQKNWEYFKFEDTLTVKIINHLKAEAHCGTFAFASITIGKIKNDTIRIVSLCNMADYKINEIIKFIPKDKPDFQFNLPYSTIYNQKDKKLNPSLFDLKVKKTTYGSAIK